MFEPNKRRITFITNDKSIPKILFFSLVNLIMKKRIGKIFVNYNFRFPRVSRRFRSISRSFQGLELIFQFREGSRSFQEVYEPCNRYKVDKRDPHIVPEVILKPNCSTHWMSFKTLPAPCISKLSAHS